MRASRRGHGTCSSACMNGTYMAIYTLLAIGVALLILCGALVFVDTARRGNRQFKWASRGNRGGPKA